MFAAARAAAAAKGVDEGVYRAPSATTGTAPPAIGLWNGQSGVPGTGGLAVHEQHRVGVELCVRTAVPEWGGQVVRWR